MRKIWHHFSDRFRATSLLKIMGLKLQSWHKPCMMKSRENAIHLIKYKLYRSWSFVSIYKKKKDKRTMTKTVLFNG
jgi:hypothetical protein